MSLTLRYMQLADVAQVVTIDKRSFGSPWSARSYIYEVSESNYSHMVTLECGTQQPRLNGWRRWLRPLNGKNGKQAMVAGYGGLWRITDEAHISTIAVHPDWRGRGWGEVLLVAMLRRAITLDAAYIVLEVRVSNTLAQNLYRKYEFQTVATKSNYYRDDHEDAYDMRLELKDVALRQRLSERFETLRADHNVVDDYTDSRRPQPQKQ